MAKISFSPLHFFRLLSSRMTTFDRGIWAMVPAFAHFTHTQSSTLQLPLSSLLQCSLLCLLFLPSSCHTWGSHEAARGAGTQDALWRHSGYPCVPIQISTHAVGVCSLNGGGKRVLAVRNLCVFKLAYYFSTSTAHEVAQKFCLEH